MMSTIFVANLSGSHSNETMNASENAKLNIWITVILVLIIVLTVLGNGLVCFVFYRQPRLRGVSHYPILSLAVADILCGVCAMPAYIAKKHTGGGDKERITCDLFRFTYFFSLYASVLSLTVISLERFAAIKMPIIHRTFLTKQKMITALLFSWFDALLVSMLPFFWQREDTNERCSYRPSKKWSIMVILMNVCVPFVIMFICHSYTVCFAVRFSRAKHKAKTGTAVAVKQNTDKQALGKSRKSVLPRRERDITCTVAIVLGVFVLCWGPSSAYYFIHMVCPQCYGPSFKHLEPIFNAAVKLLTFLNSCLNPLIYCWLNRYFRHECRLSLIDESKRREKNCMQLNRLFGKTDNSPVL